MEDSTVPRVLSVKGRSSDRNRRFKRFCRVSFEEGAVGILGGRWCAAQGRWGEGNQAVVAAECLTDVVKVR